jgi:hypothetical protein
MVFHSLPRFSIAEIGRMYGCDYHNNRGSVANPYYRRQNEITADPSYVSEKSRVALLATQRKLAANPNVNTRKKTFTATDASWQEPEGEPWDPNTFYPHVLPPNYTTYAHW